MLKNQEKGITLLILGADPPARGSKVGNVVEGLTDIPLDTRSDTDRCRQQSAVTREFACSNLAVPRKSLTGRLSTHDQCDGSKRCRHTIWIKGAGIAMADQLFLSPPPSFVAHRRLGR